MKKYFGILLSVCLVVLIGFFATKVSYQPVDTLIRPPKIEGENSDIQSAFEASVGDNYILKSPLAGEYRTSFIRKDLNSDGSDEIIVFYSLPDSIDVVRINILDKIDDSWVTISDLESTYNDIQQVSFADVDGDRNTEIIVCWRSFEAEISNTLNIYEIVETQNQKSIESFFSKNYNEFLVCDVNNDDKTDIIIFEKIAGSGTVEIKGTFYNFEQNSVSADGDFLLDPAISSIGSVCFDRDAETEELRIYVDGYKTDTGMTTDMIAWNQHDKVFYRQYDFDNSAISLIATRSKNIICSDVNGDSFIEIPVEDYIPESEFISVDSDEIKPQSAVKWMQYDGYELVAKEYEIINSDYSFSIKIPAEYYGKFTVQNNIGTGVISFYGLTRFEPNNKNDDKKPKKKDEQMNGFDGFNDFINPEENRVEDKLFSVFASSEQDLGLYELNGYRFLDNDNGFNYYYLITDEGRAAGITKANIRSILYT